MGISAQMATSSSFQLMELPDEILLTILRFLDFDSLLDAIYVNRHFRELAEPFVYESITVLHGEKALDLSHSLAKDRRRPAWVRSLLVSTKLGQDHGLNHLPPYISLMDNLYDLRLETPDCNRRKADQRMSWIRLQNEYEEIFRQSSLLVPIRENRLLPNLKSCILHFVDTHSELYSLSKYSSIFLHPTLESLTISCMYTDFPEALFTDIPDLQRLKRRTALQHLHLEECDIHPQSLELILSFPRALRSLKISEGVRYDNIFRTGSSRIHRNIKPHLLSQALVNTCRDSLESLSLALGYLRTYGYLIHHTGQHLKLDELTNLKHLECNNRTLSLVRAPTGCDHDTWKRLPSSLESLKVFAVPLLPQQAARQPYIPLEPCIIREKQLHGLSNLKKITYSYEHFESTDDDDMNFNDLLMNLVYNEANGNPAADADSPLANPGLYANPILNLLQQAVGAVNAPQPAPANTNFITTAMNAGLDVPQQNIRPPRFRWRTSSALDRRQANFELRRSDAAKLSLLNTIHNTVITHFKQTQTRLQIDLVTLPRSYIPPYLFPEEKPHIHEAWYDSADPTSPTDFINEITRRHNLNLSPIDNHASAEENTYQSERDLSRSRFLQRLRQEEAQQEMEADADADADDDDHLGVEIVSPNAHTVDDDTDDDMEVEDVLELLAQEATADAQGGSINAMSAFDDSDTESVYVDAGAEVEMSEVEDEYEEDDDGDIEDELMYYSTLGMVNQHL